MHRTITPAGRLLEIRPERGRIISPVSKGGQIPTLPYAYEFGDAYLLSNIGYIGIPDTDGVFFLRESHEYDSHMDKHIEDCFSTSFSCIDKKGDYVAVFGLWSAAFWHWMREYLPRALIAEASGFEGIYIVPQGSPFIRDSLRMIGIGPERTVVHDGGHWLVENLWVPPRMRELKDRSWIFSEMRSRLIPEKAKPVAGCRRYYMKRGHAQHINRDMVNENELMELVSGYGFEPIVMEELTLAQQIERISGADCLIGAHGAGMLHCLFMPCNSLVVELFSPIYINHCNLDIIRHMGHRYHSVLADTLDKFAGPYLHGLNVEANLELLDIILSRELG